MRSLSLVTIFSIVIGIIVGAVILPTVMSALFQLFALQGGDTAQLLRRFESPHSPREVWVNIFYGLLGGSLGGLSGYFLICLRKQDWHRWFGLCLAVMVLSLFSLLQTWYRITTDGYNTFTEALVLLLLPTLWSVSLLFWAIISSRRLNNHRHEQI